MQVVGSTADVVRAAYRDARHLSGQAAIAMGVAGAKPTASSAAASYIMNSTRLSMAEKGAFISLLADIEAAGGDAKLIARVMAIVQLTESAREEGSYPRHVLAAAVEEKTGRPAFKLRAEQALLAAMGRLDLMA